MKVLILGTSNSILKSGWVYGLRQALPSAQVDNLSVGASPGVQFGVRMNIDFSYYDFVFFDSVPNDEQYAEKVGYSHSYNDRVLYEILSSISARTYLVVLGFTLKRYLTCPSKVFENRRQLAAMSGAQFIDISSILLEFGSALAGDGNSLYEEHEAHPLSSISQLVGELIGYELANTLNSIEYYRDFNGQDSFEHNFKVWHAERDYNKERLRYYKNKQMDGTFALLVEGDTISFDAPGVCLGFYVNHAATSCSIKLKSRFEAVHRIDAYHHVNPDRLRVVFLPVTNGFEAQTLTIDGDIGNADSRSSISGNRPRLGDPVCLAVSHAAFWTGKVDADWIPRSRSSRSPAALQARIKRAIADRLTLISSIDHSRSTSLLRGQEVLLHDSLVKVSYGHLLCYDLNLNLCINLPRVDFQSEHNRHLPVYLQHSGEFAKLFILCSGRTIWLTLNSNHNLSAVAYNQEPSSVVATQFEIKFYTRGEFSLKHGGHYLCSEPGGFVTCNRVLVSSWERFSLCTSET